MKKNQKNEQNKDIYVNQNLLNIISPSGISFDNNYADIGEGVGKIFCISRYPSELDYGWLSDIVNLPGAAATVEYRYSPEDIMIAQFNRRISELKSARETERKESEIQINHYYNRSYAQKSDQSNLCKKRAGRIF